MDINIPNFSEKEAHRIFDSNNGQYLFLDEHSIHGDEIWKVDNIEPIKGKFALVRYNYNINYVINNLEKIRSIVDLRSLYMGILYEYRQDCMDDHIDNNYILISYLNPHFENMYDLDNLHRIRPFYHLSDSWFNFVIEKYLSGKETFEYWPFEKLKKIINKLVLMNYPLHLAKKLFGRCEHVCKDPNNKCDWGEYCKSAHSRFCTKRKTNRL